MANKNLFNSIQLPFEKSNVFDLSHDVKLSTKMAMLTPVLTLECVPGDKVKISHESLLRFAPMVAPVMHRMDVTIHTFYVPHRLVWPGWEKFITNEVPNAYPTLEINNEPIGGLADHLGLPQTNAPMTVSALAFGAYQMIYNEYYRDQNLEAAVNFELVNGDNSSNADLYSIRRRAWEHDYFTSALPFAQKGAPVDIPLGAVSLDPNWATNPQNPTFRQASSQAPSGSVNNTGFGTPPTSNGFIDVNGNAVAYDPEGSLEVAPTTINSLRRAFRLQEWLERSARGGSRYIEQILSHFGVRSSDKRLQRPEYITGVKSPVVISEVVNTTGQVNQPGDDPGLPQGNMAGHGTSFTSGKSGHYYCEEHGYIISVMSIMPKTAYFQGIPRHFSKFTNLDYYWPAFANIGEQEILQKEIYANSSTPEGTFGYAPRYSEYKYQPSRIAGDFKTTLKHWHLGREFAGDPALNAAFVQMFPIEADRIFAVQNGDDNLYCHVYNRIKAVRKMPKFGTPSF